MISTGTRGRQQQWRFPRGAALPPRILLQRLLCFHTLCSRTTIVHTRTFVPFAGHFCPMRAYCSRRAFSRGVTPVQRSLVPGCPSTSGSKDQKMYSSYRGPAGEDAGGRRRSNRR
uniref:(northern house mosquito) hypothetical protein n=1 Tax=Culex pipiens TaxID=7175 RepID=A0A8D8JJD5_CULPI